MNSNESIFKKELDPKFALLVVFLLALLAAAGVATYILLNWETIEPSAVSAAPRMIIFDPAETSEQVSTAARIGLPPHSTVSQLNEYFAVDSIIGYVSIDGTNISHAVVQGHDNTFFQSHNVWDMPESGGWVFLDSATSIDSVPLNTIIFGGNNPNTTQFHDLGLYIDSSVFDLPRTVRFTSDHADLLGEIFSFHVIYNSQIDFEANPSDWANELERIASLSMHEALVQTNENDRIVTLITPTEPGSASSYVLHARWFNY